MIEEKLNSVMILMIFIIGIAIGLMELELLNGFMILIIIIVLTQKARLLEVVNNQNFINIIIIILIFLLGFIRGICFELNYNKIIRKSGIYCGKVIILRNDSENKYLAKLEKDEAIQIILSTDEKLIPGMVIDIRGQLVLPNDQMNRGGFSYRKYLKYKKIYFLMYPDSIKITGLNKNIHYYLYVARNAYTSKLEVYLGDNVKYIESIFLGDNSGLENEKIDNWKKLGIIHLQAVSGTHVGVVLDILMFIFIITPKKGFIKYSLVMLPLFFYGLLVNSPSIWRVILFVIIIKIFQSLNLGKLEMLALVLSALLQIMYNPGVLFQISFQLSYMISCGMILYKIKHYRKGITVKSLFYSGIISLIFSFPLLINYFQEVSIVTVIFTPIFSPVIQLIVLVSGILMILPILINIVKPLTILLKYLLILIDYLIGLLSKMDFPLFIGGSFGLYLIIMYYLIIIAWENEKFKPIIKKIIFLFIIFLSLFKISDVHSSKESIFITFINVGQGDCILLESKESGKVILIDGGLKNETTDMGKSVVLPYLRQKGIRKIDMVVSTHADNDHIGGLNTIIEKLYVDTIFIPFARSGEYGDWINKYGDRIKEVRSGDKIYIGNMSLNILNSGGAGDPNTGSIVLDIGFFGNNILLTADCDLELMDELAETEKRYKVVKAPHHGSGNSYREGLYSDLESKCVIFSVGRNRYGHPDKNIMEDLLLDNIDYYRTDVALDIVIMMKQNSIFINGMKLSE